jgi:hypothetical protein
MSLRHEVAWLKSIIGRVPARALALLLVPVRSQPTPVTADPGPRARLTAVQR